MSDYMLTTVDNPFDPFTEFDAWLGFDVSKGYNTCAYLARVAVSSDELSEEEESEAVDLAMEDIVANDPLGIFIRVTRKS